MKGTLKSQAAFAAAFKGKRYHSKHFILFFTPGEERAYAVKVPKRVGNAVERNRLKRLMREAYFATELPGTVLLMARDSAGGAPNSEVARNLKSLLRKAEA